MIINSNFIYLIFVLIKCFKCEELLNLTNFDYKDTIEVGNYSLIDSNILRYGFHQTRECGEFPKVFICIRKCLDLNYDVARLDRLCKCRCFKKPAKASMQNIGLITPRPTQSLWTFGAPTTYPPAWVQAILQYMTEAPTPKASDSTDNTTAISKPTPSNVLSTINDTSDDSENYSEGNQSSSNITDVTESTNESDEDENNTTASPDSNTTDPTTVNETAEDGG